MKKVIFTFIALWLSLGTFAQVKYKVEYKGEQTGNFGEMVYLLNCEDNSVLGSARMVGGNVMFQGQTKENVVAALSTNENKQKGAFKFFILDATPISFKLNEITSGSDANRRFSAYQKRLSEQTGKMEALAKEYRELYRRTQGQIPQEKIEEIEQRYETAETERHNVLSQALKENGDNLIPVAFLLLYAEDIGYESVAKFMKTYKYADRTSLTPLKEVLKREQAKLPGAKVIDFTMKDLNDKPVKLTQWVGRGNYVLVDFWASWCGPCRADMPHVKSLYEKYHPKGFEIVGVSLDRSKEDWAKAVKDLGISWPQMSDLKYWQSEGAALYNIRAIPATIFFAPDGTVVAAELRGESLTKKLEEIYE